MRMLITLALVAVAGCVSTPVEDDFACYVYDVWWDHRTEIHVEPPLAPSVLTKIVTTMEGLL